jgi:hypothetical protein
MRLTVQDGEVVGSVASVGTHLIVGKGNIHAPMQMVLDTPVRTNRLRQAASIGCQAAEVEIMRLPWVEEFPFPYPKVQDVQCVGVPDMTYGEELCACIVLRPRETTTDEEICSYCRGEIAYYKIPRYVRFMETLPMTVTGKIQKYILRRQLADELGLQDVKTA